MGGGGGGGGPPPEKNYRIRYKIRHFLCISIQQEGKWHLCNMHNLIVIRLEKLHVHEGTQLIY